VCFRYFRRGTSFGQAALSGPPSVVLLVGTAGVAPAGGLLQGEKTMSDYDWTIEITPTARAAISREIKAQWDGRELGGALVGHTDGKRIVVTNANGIGTGVETPRGESWIRPSRSRWFDYARACGADLVGDWHCHPGGSTTVPSDQDVRSWQATREALRSPVHVGLIFLPRRVHVQGINYSEAAWSFRDPEVGEYVITEAGYQRTRFVLSGRDRHELSVY